MTRQQHPHPWHPVHQRKTAHAVAVHRPCRGDRGRCLYPDPCACPACRTRWLLVLGGGEGERWASRYTREPAALTTEALRLGSYLALAAWVGYHAYIIVSTGGAHL